MTFHLLSQLGEGSFPSEINFKKWRFIVNQSESTQLVKKAFKVKRKKEMKGFKGISYRPKKSISATKSFRPTKNNKED
jgi:hypothetical protein